MDRYMIQEGSQSDTSPEWIVPGPETGIPEGVWRLGLGEGAFGYPARPDEADCIYYLRTGFCGYGSRCRFNHPLDRGAVFEAARGSGEEFPQRVGQPVCQYYMRTGMCKYGASCKYHHPKQGVDTFSPVPQNCYGYPLRQGEKECTYYIKTGHCKFGSTCKFHHPEPVNIQIPPQSMATQVAPVPAPVPAHALYPMVPSQSFPSTQQYGLVVARPPLLPGSYSPYGPVLFSPGIVPYPNWSAYPIPVSPSTQPAAGSGSVYGMTPLSPSAPAYTRVYHAIPTLVGPSGRSPKEQVFPERPDQPVCQRYMKTGDCKYGSSCRYHHPPDLIAPNTTVTVSPMGLPLRHGAPPCTNYTQHGQCKFGSACKFDHPFGAMSYSPSASSLADMPVVPYPVRTSVGTLAPSSSSLELRPELISGSIQESSSTRMSSSMTMSSGLVSLNFSKSGPAPNSSSLLSGQISGASAVSSGSMNIHTSS